MVKHLYSNYKYYIITLLITLLLTESRVYSQVNTTAQQNKLQRFNPLTDRIEDVLPPLSVLLDSAEAHSPLVNYESLHAVRNKYELKKTKQEWSQNFGVNIDAGWGEWINNDWSEFTKQLPYLMNQSYRWNYAISVYMRYPLSTIVRRKNDMMINKKEIEMSLALRDLRANEGRLEVIRYYNLMIQAQSKLKISNDYQEYTRQQMLMADLQFANHEIEVAEYARLKEIQTRGAYDHEQNKTDFSMNYQLLEERTGIKFNLINELK